MDPDQGQFRSLDVGHGRKGCEPEWWPDCQWAKDWLMPGTLPSILPPLLPCLVEIVEGWRGL
ncbi:hypothetical protein VFPPC_11015 [Pochonia chlamydosporia 170]|uniref:Uncharacterized protein n=1 Tax=Pochonia chlamydosporia 170 TaxID=1380566 RepID=A0A179F0Q7_METCM|nr:hypothetical protein VFPPC_11015 [Pochonia chlamydosporia 170]OAQ58830.1 hypothetical protein VFPPC_11015 [Pochonia chlamydosporia 170]